MPPQKRLEFFSGENWAKGLEWYESHFERAGTALARGEASNSYTTHPVGSEAPARIAATLPDVQLVYIVRDPIDRIISHYRQAAAHFNEDRPLEAVLRDSPANYVAVSKYAMQLDRYLEHFPREQLHVLVSEDMRRDRVATLDRLARFIGVEPCFADIGVEIAHNASAGLRREGSLAAWLRKTPLHGTLRKKLPASVRRAGWRAASRPAAPAGGDATLSDQARGILLGRLRPDLVRLREIIGGDFDCWGLLDDARRPRS